MRYSLLLLSMLMAFQFSPSFCQDLKINEKGYFEMQGLNVTVFSDIYPDGHQTGVTVIQHGNRVAANGDLRLEASPGQWSPVPKGGKLRMDSENGTLTQELWYPDSSKNRQGFNPIYYPDLTMKYRVEVSALDGSRFQIKVHLDEPIPEEWSGKIGFNFELFPGDLFGKSWLLDEEAGIFTQQPNGPIRTEADEQLSRPLATGNHLVIAPESDLQRMRITSESGTLELRDGRSNHNNGWFIVREVISSNQTANALTWVIEPHVIDNWVYEPVIQVSQLGYHTAQDKKVVIETDPRDALEGPVEIFRLSDEGRTRVKAGGPEKWGSFLRYDYLIYDFSDIRTPGMYLITFAGHESNVFRIGEDIFSRDAWQPVIEYFLPVQMCHMRVNEKYRVWHDFCHLDDARMAPLDTNHFDGYVQGPETLTNYTSGQTVPGLNKGGWHDAGDYDLRVESQIGTVWNLALMIEEFGLDYDATDIDNESLIVEIHEPDGKSDAIQQIEHGLATVLGGYRALGRLYRGIICPTLRQYVMLGDASSMTDNLWYHSVADGDGYTSNVPDDRWVFTENNPRRELYVAGGLAAAARVLKNSNPELSAEALDAARLLYSQAQTEHVSSRVIALSELILATGDSNYKEELISLQDKIVEQIGSAGWAVGHVISEIDDKKFTEKLEDAVRGYNEQLRKQQQEDSPYGVPYKPNIWGAGWTIQRFGVEQYFFYKGWPEICSPEFTLNSLNFVLGVHPGINTSSFASGVGAESVTVAYGVNRADWSFIPGGVASGTALIRPDLPEMKIWPFFWQQTEYVMGGGSTNYMFLAMAAEKLFKDK